MFNILTGTLGKVIGRHNLVRYGNFISRAGRLDFPNGLTNNGETLVQRVVLGAKEVTPKVIVDCGANIGEWTYQLCRESELKDNNFEMDIYSFEPSAYTYRKLVSTIKNIGDKENIRFSPVNKALSSRIGEANLAIANPGAGTNSLVYTENIQNQKMESVHLTTLDYFVEQNNISHISLLKIDAEGHDPDVIKGAERLIANQNIGVIQFEYNWRWIFGNNFLRNVFMNLSENGYHLGKVTPKGIQFFPRYSIELETFVESNYIACTDEWVDKFPVVDYWKSNSE
jgi:FkbM family methyltransferase